VHTDIPTRADLEQLLSARGGASVSIYLPTAPEERGGRGYAYADTRGGMVDGLDLRRYGAQPPNAW
jgi:hypothetical protein